MKIKTRIAVFVLILAMVCFIFFWAMQAMVGQKNNYMSAPSITPLSTNSQEEEVDAADATTSITEPVVESTPEPTILPEYEEYLKINTDVVGKIEIPDTIISYPVLWDSSIDYYYLHRDINKKESVKGSVCLENTNSMAAKQFAENTLIFGHNMKDKSMFHSVTQYKDKKFFEEHPLIYFSNLYEEATWRVFAVYLVDANKEGIQTTFNNDKEFLEYAEAAQKKSMYKTDVELKETDHIITLCTCSYEFSNARTIVQAVRVDQEMTK